MKKGVRKDTHLGMDDRATLYIAMNASSPTGMFRDSAGYVMLQQRTYAAQLAAAQEMDRQRLKGQK